MKRTHSVAPDAVMSMSSRGKPLSRPVTGSCLFRFALPTGEALELGVQLQGDKRVWWLVGERADDYARAVLANGTISNGAPQPETKTAPKSKPVAGIRHEIERDENGSVVFRDLQTGEPTRVDLPANVLVANGIWQVGEETSGELNWIYLRERRPFERF